MKGRRQEEGGGDAEVNVDQQEELRPSGAKTWNNLWVYKLVPWLNWDEWDHVRVSLFSSSSESVASAFNRISAWYSRGCLPVAIEATAAVFVAQQKDTFFRAKAYLPGFQVLPLRQFGIWGPEVNSKLDPDKDTDVMRRHGVRSLQFAKWLQSQGFKRVYNIAGGIHAYAVDPPRRNFVFLVFC